MRYLGGMSPCEDVLSVVELVQGVAIAFAPFYFASC